MKYDEAKKIFKEKADKKTYDFVNELGNYLNSFGRTTTQTHNDYTYFKPALDEVYEETKMLIGNGSISSGRIGDEYCIEQYYFSPESGFSSREFFSKKITIDAFVELEKLETAFMELIFYYANNIEYIQTEFVSDGEIKHWTDFYISGSDAETKISKMKQFIELNDQHKRYKNG